MGVKVVGTSLGLDQRGFGTKGLGTGLDNFTLFIKPILKEEAKKALKIWKKGSKGYECW